MALVGVTPGEQGESFLRKKLPNKSLKLITISIQDQKIHL